MVDEAEQLISEIVQIKNQYVVEVGRGRRAWPKSIKERVARLDEIGISPKVVASRTSIPYDTIVLWRYNRRHGVHGRLKKGFHELKVATAQAPLAAPTVGILKSATVTVPEIKMRHPSLPPSSSLRLTTPTGFIIEGLDDRNVVRLIGDLTRLGGENAS